MSMLERFVNKFKAEGVDHIRISPYAETRIGKIVSKEWRQTFFIPHMGEFTSPVCFANWLCTGDDEARHNTAYRFNETIKGYLNFVLYGKYYQLCAMKSALMKEMVDLPFVAYKQHVTGLKEFDRWKEYPAIVKDMIEHVLDENRGPKKPYLWDNIFPGLEDKVNERITLMVGEVVKKPPTPKKEKQKKPKIESDRTDQPVVDPDSQLNYFPPVDEKQESETLDDDQRVHFPPVTEMQEEPDMSEDQTATKEVQLQE